MSVRGSQIATPFFNCHCGGRATVYFKLAGSADVGPTVSGPYAKFDRMLIFRRSWGVNIIRSRSLRGFPRCADRASSLHMTLCGYCNLCAETRVCPLTLVGGSNVTMFGFVPDVFFTVDSTANKVVAIGFVTAGIGILLDFWYQFLHNRAAAAKFQVRYHSRVYSLPSWMSALSHDTVMSSITLVLQYCPRSVAPGGPSCLFLGRYACRPTTPLV